MSLLPSKATDHRFTEFESAIRPHYEVLKAYCNYLTKNSSDGEDLVQETLFKAFKMYMKNPLILQNRAYLMKIAYNAWLNFCRKKHCPIHHMMDIERIAQEEEVETYEIEAAIQWLVKNLTPPQRSIFLLMDVMGYSAVETAQLLRSTEGAVKASLHRARKKLSSINQDADEEGASESLTQAYMQAFQAQDAREIASLANVFTMSLHQSRVDRHTFAQGMSALAITSQGNGFVLSRIQGEGIDMLVPTYFKAS
ncbi:RNA polymerase sigma factor [Ammoniphilus sp. YIM 78166]|uniref:RNA polymerase sigma factor n=1 Tax=Ammoniphilus sp. YIM 78166 TaxID=1644106 RepID=UPI001430B191|nr:RNA polymerase sigma factor [Ammoniphilus sp. YIM 78166]